MRPGAGWSRATILEHPGRGPTLGNSPWFGSLLLREVQVPHFLPPYTEGKQTVRSGPACVCAEQSSSLQNVKDTDFYQLT